MRCTESGALGNEAGRILTVLMVLTLAILIIAQSWVL